MSNRRRPDHAGKRSRPRVVRPDATTASRGRLRVTTAAAIVTCLLLSAVPATGQGWDTVASETVLDGLNGPIDIALAPDGAIWWNEYYTGDTVRWDPETDERVVMFHADPIEGGVERGLVGLALDPDLEDNGVFYVYYTVPDPDDADAGTNRLSRIDGTGEEEVLLTTPAYKLHNGGRIQFASDGTLFVSTGDNEESTPAQDPSSRLGKILHLHPDGTPAADNIEGHVHSLGHRNVYGLAYDTDGGRLFATENNNAERDEVNLIEAGGNYGWPECEGHVRFDLPNMTDTDEPCDDPRFIAPIGEFYPDGTAAPTGAAFVDGALYWGAWNQGEIHQMVEDTETGSWSDTVVHSTGGRINDLEAAADGSALYYANWTAIVRVPVPEDAHAGTKESIADSGPHDGTADVGEGDAADDEADAPAQLPGPGALATVLMAMALAVWARRRDTA